MGCNPRPRSSRPEISAEPAPAFRAADLLGLCSASEMPCLCNLNKRKGSHGLVSSCQQTFLIILARRGAFAFHVSLSTAFATSGPGRQGLRPAFYAIHATAG